MQIVTDVWKYLITLPLSDYGSWASVLGFFISLFTLILVGRLKKSFMFRSRVDVQGDFLQEQSSELSKLLASYSSNLDEITNIFTKVKVKLRVLRKGAKGDLQKDVNNTISKIDAFLDARWHKDSSHTPKEKNAREIYSSINIIIEELDNVKSELVVGS